MDEVEKVPSIGISYTAELPGKKALVLQSFIGRDDSADALNAVLDKVRTAAERQVAFGMVEHLKLQLEQEEKLANDHAQRMSELDTKLKEDWGRAGKRGDPRLSSREQDEQRKAHWHGEECRRRIAKVKADIAEYQAKIGA